MTYYIPAIKFFSTLNNQKKVLKRSMTGIKKGMLASFELTDKFPVSQVDFNSRTEHPKVTPHIHNCLELGYCFSGAGVFLVGNKILPFKAGDAVIISEREIHIAKANPNTVSYWGFVNLDIVKLLINVPTDLNAAEKLSKISGSSFCNIIDGSKYPQLCDKIKELLFERRDEPYGSCDYIRLLASQIVLLTKRKGLLDLDDEEQSSHSYSDIERIAPAVEYINKNLTNDIEIGELAKLCYSSSSNFRKLFFKAMGCPASSYILDLRLNIALTMLQNSNQPVYVIANECGIPSLPHFNRSFKRKFGATPAEMRKKKQ